MARENAVFEAKVDPAKRTVSIRVVATGKEYVLDLATVSAECVAYAALHGFKQRLVDNTAIARADKDGNVRSATEQARLREEALAEMVAHYASGSPNWTIREPGKGGKKPAFDMWEVVRAVETVSGKGREVILSMFDRRAQAAGSTREKIAESMALDPKVAAEIARARAAAADTSLVEDWEKELGEE